MESTAAMRRRSRGRGESPADSDIRTTTATYHNLQIKCQETPLSLISKSTMEVTAAFVPVATQVAAKIISAFQEGRLTRDQEAAIKKAVSRSVLGGNTNLRREPDDYAQSPIIAHTKKNCSRSGIIYVAYVPNNNGKTTACYASMDKPYARRGIAFFPESTHGVTYFDSMVGSLGFDFKTPPIGFMRRILEELEKGGALPELPRNLIALDNFMPHWYNDADNRFLHNLIGHIKEKKLPPLSLHQTEKLHVVLSRKTSWESSYLWQQTDKFLI